MKYPSSNLFANDDLNIIDQRKTGYSFQHLVDSFKSCNKHMDDLVCINHVAKVCKVEKLGFTSGQLLKVFDKTFEEKYHESKVLAWKFLSKQAGRKLIRFKAVPMSKVSSAPCKQKKIKPVTALKKPTGVFGWVKSNNGGISE